MVVPFAHVRLQQDTLDAMRDPTLERVWLLTLMVVPFALVRLQQDILDAIRYPTLDKVRPLTLIIGPYRLDKVFANTLLVYTDVKLHTLMPDKSILLLGFEVVRFDRDTVTVVIFCEMAAFPLTYKAVPVGGVAPIPTLENATT